MNNDTGGDHPMPGTRMRRLFDENLSMIETMTRIEIRGAIAVFVGVGSSLSC